MRCPKDQPKANKVRLDNRWGCSVGHAFPSFEPQSRLDDPPAPAVPAFNRWQKKMKIRVATRDDATAVRRVHLEAFPQGEGDIVSRLAVDLLSEETAPPVISLVSEADDIVVGHVALSPVWMSDTRELLGYILTPLAVSPRYQKRGIGSQLIKSSIERVSVTGSDILLVYGDPKFYGRFGFSVDVAECYTPPYQLQYSFGWQGMVLRAFNARRSAVSISCVSSLCVPSLW